jgi:hypothetical protein
MIDKIKTSCEAETAENSRVLNAMEEISSTLSNNLSSAQASSHASTMLLGQVEFLISAVNQFKRGDNTVEMEQAPTENMPATPLYHKDNYVVLQAVT